MNDVAQSIVEKWQQENPEIIADFDSIKVKNFEPEFGVYTVYFNAGADKIRIKAINQGSEWKLTNMS